MLMLMESFDGYNGSSALMAARGPYSQTASLVTPGRTGSHCIQSINQVYDYPGGNNANKTIINQFAFWWTPGNTTNVFFYGNGTTNTTSTFNTQSYYILNGVGALILQRGGTQLDIATSVFIANSWNYVELKITFGTGTSGAYAAKVNGIQVFAATGVNTCDLGNNSINSTTWNIGSNASKIDDLILMDGSGPTMNDFIGDHKVELLRPQAGNGSNVGLTPSSGTDHGAMVDDVGPNDDTDYNFGTTAGLKDTYNMENLTTTGVVKAVQIVTRAKKTDTPTKAFAPVMRLGGVDYDIATTRALGTSYGFFTHILETRPSDSGAWTVADVNGAEVGAKIVQ